MLAFLAFIFFQVVLPAAMAYFNSLRFELKTSKKGQTKITLPTSDEGRPFPVVSGTRRVKGINAISPLLYQHNYFAEHHDMAAVLYYIAAHFGICLAADGIKQFWFEETCAWPTVKDPTDFAADGQTTAVIPFLEGGTMWGIWFDGGRGGVYGTIRIQYGGPAQTLDSYLESKLGSNQPAYRGFVGFIMEEPFFIGISGSIPLPSAVVKRTDIFNDNSPIWYSTKSAIDRGGGVYDLNPIHFSYELLTSSIIGRGHDTSLIGDSFTEAADTCYEEELGIANVWDWSADDIGGMIAMIEKIIDGRLYFSRETQKYEWALNRPDYNPAALEVFDEDDFWVESASFLSTGGIASKVIVLWEDRIYCNDRIAYDDDIALLARQANRNIVDEKDYKGFICDGDMANKIAARDQYALSSMPKIFTLHCLRTMAHLHENSVFKISYPELNISAMIVRLVTINRGSLQNGEIIIECIEDVFGQGYTCYGSPPGPGAEPAEPTTNIVVRGTDYVMKGTDRVVRG